MLLSDHKVAKQAETIGEVMVFFIIPVLLILTNTVPFNQRHLLLGTVTTTCLAIYFTKANQPDLTLSKQSLIWLIPAILTGVFISAATSMNLNYNANLLVYAVLISTAQEFLFREYLQKRLTKSYTSTTSITVTSMLFAAAHIIYADPLPTLLITLFFSLAVSTAYHYADNLILASLVHAKATYLAINTCLIAIPGTC